MSASDSTPLQGQVIPPKRSLPTSLDGFAALNQLVEAASDCIEVHATEKTAQARITAYETTEVTRIKAAEGVLRSYFDNVFAERRASIDAMFQRLDGAIESGNAQAISEMVNGVVDIAKSSPLADLGNLSEIRAALDDPDQVWDL